MQKIIDKIKNVMVNLFKKIKELAIKAYNNENVRAFFYIYLIGLFFFSIIAITNHFTIPMTGDYTLQTYAFYSQGYYVFWNFIKTGEYPLYDFTNYLGANYLGTQSFYYVFSPLFYLLCLWPEKLLYQGIFFHMVFKFALGGFFMYILLKKYFGVNYKISRVGGLIYAFSGFSLFYLWFHFGDIIAFFPLFFIGIEKCLKERKGWLLSISIWLCGMSNYFFLVNICIFGAFYAIYRWIYIYGINKKRGYSAKVRWGVLLQGIAFSLVGVMMAAICLLPSLEVIKTTNRTQTGINYLIGILSTIFKNPSKIDGKLVLGEAKSIKDILSVENLDDLFAKIFVWNDRSYSNMTVPGKNNIGYILSNWIFMNTSCWDNVMFDNVALDNTLGGFFITTPLTMLLVPSIYNVIKSKRPWAIFGVIVCLLLPFIPFTYHAAFAFTGLYGRWQFWIVILGIIFIIPTLDKYENVDRRFVTINLILNYTFALIAFILSKKSGHLPYNNYIPGTKINEMFLIMIAELVFMAIVWFFYRFKIFKAGVVKKVMTFFVIIEVGASILITIENKGYAKWNTYYLSQPDYTDLKNIIKEVKDEDDSFYRIMNTEATRVTMTLPTQLNYNGASTFSSTYNFNLDTFKNRSRMAYGGGWTMGNHEKRYWLDQYIGTKYYVIDKDDINNDNNESYRDRTVFYDGRTRSDEEQQKYNLNLGWNYKLYKSNDNYDVYINEQFIGIGYTLDSYIKSSSAGTGSVATLYEELYSKYAILLDDGVEAIKDYDNIKSISSYQTTYKTFYQSNFDLYFSPREDYSKEKDYKRHEYKLTSNGFTQKEISSILPSYSQFFHKRWEDKQRFGDQLILKLKDGKEKPCSDASSTNQYFINIPFKLGPKTLISIYNGDKLITQDAHMHSNNSLSKVNYEWKLQRGFYIDQPFDKIVIEFLSDTTFDKVFLNGSLSSDINITYCSQKTIQARQDEVNKHLFKDVKYKKNTFTFTSEETENRIGVTNIPYDDGWTLYANGEKQEIFNVNGGFIGFVVKSGTTSYSLKYFTPKLKEGLIFTGSGILLLIALCYIYKKRTIDILANERLVNEKYNLKQEEIEKEEISDFNNKINTLIKKIKNFFKKGGK